MVENLALSPLAFWMSYSTPAASNASPRKRRSAVSQRADDAASGRITPILPLASPLSADPPPPPPPSSSSPHAANASDVASTAAIAKMRPLIDLLLRAPPRTRGWHSISRSRGTRREPGRKRAVGLADHEGDRTQHLRPLSEHAGD